ATPRAHVRATSQVIRCELRHFIEAVAGQTMRDEMMRAIDKEQGPFFRRQTLSASAVQVRQVAIARFDDVGERDGPRALRALHLHVTPRYPRWSRFPASLITARPDGPNTLKHSTPSPHPRPPSNAL